MTSRFQQKPKMHRPFVRENLNQQNLKKKIEIIF